MTILAVIEVFIGAVAAVGAVFAWRYWSRPAGRPLVLVFIAGAGYALASGVNMLLSDPLYTHLVHHLTYPFGSLVAIAGLFLAIEFTGRLLQYRRPLAILLGGYLALELVLAMTDPIHQLIITERIVLDTGEFVRDIDNTGPYFWVRTAASFSLGIAGLLLVATSYPRTKGIYREQTRLVLLAFLIVITSFGIQTFVSIHPGFDIGSVGLLVGAGLLLWALFSADFLDSLPVGRSTLLEQLHDGVLAIDAERRVIDFNASAQSLLGLSEEDIGTPVDEALVSIPTLVSLLEEETDVTREIEVTVDDETWHYRVTVSTIDTPPTHRFGEQGVLLLIRDITDLVQQRQDLELKNQRLDRFASLVSHDLQDPLLLADRYLRNARESGDVEDFDRVEDALHRMATMIENLLELSRLERTTEALDEIELAAIVQASWELVEHDASTTIEIETDRIILGTYTNVQRLLENLLRNAVKHGGYDVTIRIGELNDGFYVEDDGKGVPPSERTKVFETGYSAAEHGTGYGLTIVQQIAADHGWTVELVESETGGARFEFTGVTFA